MGNTCLVLNNTEKDNKEQPPKNINDAKVIININKTITDEKTVVEPVAEQLASESISVEVVAEPVVEPIIVEPVVVEPVVVEPVVVEPVVEPVAVEPVVEPVAVEPVVVEPVAVEPVFVEPVVVEPVVVEPVVEPVIEKKVNNPTIPSDEEFVNYLSSLWSNDKDNLRILNNLPYVDNITDENLKILQEKVETNFEKLKIVGNFHYLNKLEKEVRLSKNDLTIDDLKLTYFALQDLETHNEINNTLMSKINKVMICPLIKDVTGNKLNTKNYRFLQLHSKTLKLIDRLWCLKVYDIVKLLDTKIFKSTLLRDMNSSVVVTASENTISRENVVLIDIEKAFDSCDYEVVETLLYRNLLRRTNIELAKKLTAEYMYIIRQRIIYFNDKIINFKRGIPTGLPSSNIIFSLIMDEIINEWFITHNEVFKIDKDFLLNIFVDDVYLKIINVSLKDLIVKTLVDMFTKYKFNVNFEKCKADENLKLEFFTNLEETDYYLGIPFTRDVKKYCDLILKKFNSINNCEYTYKELYDKIKNNDKDKKLIYGYLNYKLKPLMLEDDLLIFMEKTLLKDQVAQDQIVQDQIVQDPVVQDQNSGNIDI
jgi:hypothetical protein